MKTDNIEKGMEFGFGLCFGILLFTILSAFVVGLLYVIASLIN